MAGGSGTGGTVPGRCGDGQKDATEVCDGGGSGSTALGSCNPECTGFYEKKFIRETRERYSGNLGGPAGADTICRAEFGSGWKALLVGGGRRATVAPAKGDGQLDWVVRKYTHYYNENDELVWRTDDVALLGVRAGQRMNLYADAFFRLDFYPWGGFDSNWVEVPRSDVVGADSGTCAGWSTIAVNEIGTFPLPDLTMGRTEPCGGSAPLLCVQQ